MAVKMRGGLENKSHFVAAAGYIPCPLTGCLRRLYLNVRSHDDASRKGGGAAHAFDISDGDPPSLCVVIHVILHFDLKLG